MGLLFVFQYGTYTVSHKKLAIQFFLFISTVTFLKLDSMLQNAFLAYQQWRPA